MFRCDCEDETARVTVARAFRRSGFVIILLSAALSGCGSDDDSGSSASTTTSSVSRGASENETTLGAWAAGLCQGIASWEQTVKTTSAELDKSQADFASASQAISSTNQALIASLEGLGTPPAPATTDAKQVIDELSTNLKDDAGEIQQTLNGTFSTQAEIASASTKVRSSISKMNADISNAVTELKALPEEEGWKKSFQRAPACQIVAKG
jgi:septal ring factor EnvC (AmiA/AmiB activator)